MRAKLHQTRHQVLILVPLIVAISLLLLTTSTRVLGLAGGRDQFDSELTNLQIELLPNPGCPWPRMMCSAGTLTGPTIIQREQAALDPSGKTLLINTEVISIEMTGTIECVPSALAAMKNKPVLGFSATVGTSSRQKSPGQIRTTSFYTGPITDTYPSPPSPKGCGIMPCTLENPAYSFFDIFVAARVNVPNVPPLAVSLLSQDALRMQANITQMPPYRGGGVFLPYGPSGWVSASEAGQYGAEIHELPLKLYYNGLYCANLKAHPDHFPIPPVPPGPGVVINEFMPQPASDWNNDGRADSDDEYIELYNRGDAAVDLSACVLDTAKSSRTYSLPADTVIAPQGFLVFFRSQTDVELDDAGDTVQLWCNVGTALLVDAAEYTSSRPDVSYSRAPDGAGGFTQSLDPTPGSRNQTICISDPPVVINEFMPQPASDWNKDGRVGSDDEYIELFNRGNAAVDLGGLVLGADKRSRAYTIPVGTVIAPQGFRVFFRSQTGVELDDVGDTVVVARARCGSGVVDAVEYASSQPDVSYSRAPDGTGEFTQGFDPTPGSRNQRIRITLNEFMPQPSPVRHTDNLANAATGYIDEYIELYNDNEFSWDLGNWMLNVDIGGMTQSLLLDSNSTYTIPVGSVIPAHGVLVFFKDLIGLDLPDNHGVIRWLRPDGFVEDEFEYADSQPGVAYGRLPNGTGPFVRTDPSPGESNRFSFFLYLPVIFER